MSRTVLAAFVPLGFLTVCAVPSRAQDAAELTALCIEAYGGPDAIAAASAFVQTGQIVSTARVGSAGRILRAFQRPDRLRVEVAYADRDVEVRVLSGGRGWRDGRPVSGPLHSSMVLQAIRLDLPSFLLVATEQISEGEPIERDGHMFRVLALEVGGGLALTAEIDPKTGRIHRTIAHISLEGSPRPLEFITEYSDFRDVNGVLFAFREVTHAQGRHTADITLEDVRTFDVLPDEHFDPDPGRTRL